MFSSNFLMHEVTICAKLTSKCHPIYKAWQNPRIEKPLFLILSIWRDN